MNKTKLVFAGAILTTIFIGLGICFIAFAEDIAQTTRKRMIKNPAINRLIGIGFIGITGIPIFYTHRAVTDEKYRKLLTINSDGIYVALNESEKIIKWEEINDFKIVKTRPPIIGVDLKDPDSWIEKHKEEDQPSKLSMINTNIDQHNCHVLIKLGLSDISANELHEKLNTCLKAYENEKL